MHNTPIIRSCDDESLPTLSVVFPNYNDARFLATQLDSILQQSYLPQEIIIIDDASTDNSVEIIREYVAKDPRIRLILNDRNIGVENNMNRLIREAKSEYLYLSAADDKVLPGFFEKTMRLLARYPQAGLCTGLGRLMNEAGRDSGLRSLPIVSKKPCYLTPSEIKCLLIKYGRWFAISSMIIRRDALLAENGQTAAVGPFADNLAAMILALKHGACFYPDEFSSWRQKRGSNGTSASWQTMSDQGRLIFSLMRSKYSNLFSERLVRRFEQHWRYGVHAAASTQIRKEAERGLVSLSWDEDNRISFQRAARLAVSVGLTCSFGLWRIYAVLRYGPWGWWIRGRLSIALNRGTLVIRENQNP